MKTVYICHPYSDNPESNRARVENICSKIIDNHWLNGVGPKAVPVAPQLFLADIIPQRLCEHTDDAQLSHLERVEIQSRRAYEAAMQVCLHYVSISDELWVFGDQITEGMAREIEYASAVAMTIRVFRSGFEDENEQ